MRSAYEFERPASATPIYDALYAEFRRLFRSLPGDRSGEEGWRFTAFGTRDPYGDPYGDPGGTRSPDAHGRDHGESRGQGQGNAPGRSHADGGSHADGRSQRQEQDGIDCRQQQADHPHGGHGDAAPRPAHAQQEQKQERQMAPVHLGNGWTPVGHLPPAHSPAHSVAHPPLRHTGGRHRGLLSLPRGGQ
jgi:hypothetical protein